jgi:hypothetical protein
VRRAEVVVSCGASWALGRVEALNPSHRETISKEIVVTGVVVKVVAL